MPTDDLVGLWVYTMDHLARQLESLFIDGEARLSAITDAEAGAKPRTDAWSKKEILGHLVDSAANNHHRIVRGARGSALEFPLYQQSDWVRIQQYQARPWSDIVALWVAYNRHLRHIISALPADAQSAQCDVGAGEPVTLRFVVEDYLAHMKHHLEVVFGQPV